MLRSILDFRGAGLVLLLLIIASAASAQVFYPDFHPVLLDGWGAPVFARPALDFDVTNVPLPTLLNGDASCYLGFTYINSGIVAADVNATLRFDEDLFINVNHEAGAYQAYWWYNQMPWASGGRHTVWQELDPDNLVQENSETNNGYAHQWVWKPQDLGLGTQQVRAHPPVSFTGTQYIPDGVTVFPNLDGVRLQSSTSWWRGVAISSTDPGYDCDLVLLEPSAGAADGFDYNYLATSGLLGADTDVVITNCNTVLNPVYDVGVRKWDQVDSDYSIEYGQSTVPFLIGEGEASSVADQSMLKIYEFLVPEAQSGIITIDLMVDTVQPVKLAVFDASFTEGGLTGASHLVETGPDGRAMVELEAPAAGYYGIAIVRNAYQGTAAFDFTLKVWPPTPDLVPGAPPEWYAPLVPSIDPGLNAVVPAPDHLDGDVTNTHLYTGFTNQGSAATNNFHVQSLVDGVAGIEGFWSYWDIPANPDHRHGFRFSTYNIPGGRHTASYMLDSWGEVDEFNEDNNGYSSQWVWMPTQLEPETSVMRATPPDPFGGFDHLPDGTPLFSNVDGLRTQTFVRNGNDGFWGGIAILPEGDADFDLRLHAPTTDPQTGFDTILERSEYAGSRSDFILMDFDGAQPFGSAWDAGVYRFSNDANYAIQTVRSTYLNSDGWALPSTFGAFTVPAGQVMGLYEFHVGDDSSGEITFHIDVRQLSGNADLGVSVFVRNDTEGFYSKSEGAFVVNNAGEGGDEGLEVTLAANTYVGLVVWKNDSADLPRNAEFEIRFLDPAMSPVPEGSQLPSVSGIESAYPNPFNPQTTVVLAMRQAGPVSVKIYDVQGRLVRTLADETLPAGRHEMSWNGRDASGRAVPSGLYFVRAIHPDGTDRHRISLVK